MQEETNEQYVESVASDCEYFTQVVLRGSRDEEAFYRTTASLAEAKLNPASAYQLIVQASYLSFFCFCRQIPLTINPKQDVVVDARQVEARAVTPLLRYSLSGQQIRSLKSFLLEVLTAILAFYNKTATPLSSMPVLDSFSRELALIRDVNFQEETNFIMALEETALFRNNSMALRLMNCLFMHLLKKDKDTFERFFQCRKKQAELVAAYNEAKKSKNDSKVNEHSKEINQLVSEFFVGLSNLLGCSCTKFEGDSANELKLTLKLKEKELGFVGYLRKFTQGTVVPEPSDFKPAELEYSVEYNGERNSLTVRLFTDHKLTVQQGDFLLFQLNRLTYDSIQVSIEVSDSTDKQQPNRPKQIILKTTQLSMCKQNVFQSIMELLDTLTVVYKVIEPQLVRIITRQIDISEETHRRINHYMRIFKNCYRCVYRLDQR